ncbi:AAA family ATPase [Mesorhizobium sp. A623]
MRIKSITIEGFRAFGRTATIDLDADVIILQGPNGVGKTSLLDAILWALAGHISRFQDRGSPVSIYAREGIARVELTFNHSQRGDVVVVRATDGSATSVRLKTENAELEGAAAQQELCNLLLPHLTDRSESLQTLENVLTRGVYLQQDLVRQFVEGDSAIERFALISEVIGAGVVLELQQALEKSRNQWSRSTSALRKEEIEPLRGRVAQIDEQLARLTDAGAGGEVDAGTLATSLFERAITLMGQSRVGSDEPPTTPSRLDRFLKSLTTERARIEREVGIAAGLGEQTRSLEPDPVDYDTELARLELEESNLATELKNVDERLRNEIARLEEERERQVAERDKAKRLAALARLALDDLGDHCPVCEQTHDREHTVRHLRELIASASEEAEVGAPDERLSALNAGRSVAQQRLEGVKLERRAFEDNRRERAAQRSVLLTRLSDMGVNTDHDIAEQLQARRTETEASLRTVANLITEGEQLSLSIVRLGEGKRREELMAERAALVSRLGQASAKADSQDRTHAEAGRIIDGLRNASLLVTRRQIEQIAPLFQRIYSRIDPHPTFRTTQIIADMERGKGHLHVGIADPDAGSQQYDAGPVLSSSQLNSFAVSLFLAMNLALPAPALGVTVLDDPLQSLDSINLLGLVDVLRRFRAHRQIIVSTHEERLMGLLQRKLRPVKHGERLISIAFEDWSREGPVFREKRTEYVGSEEKVLAA